MMIGAGRIKRRAATRTARFAVQIFPNGEFPLAGAAQNRALLPFCAGPNYNRVPRQRNVTILTSIVNAAALHFDCDNVQRGAVVRAAGLRIEIDAANFPSWVEALRSHVTCGIGRAYLTWALGLLQPRINLL